MYTVTFYSFKGGVGRSMALINVAAELAQNGKRVLVVDFDLEAPGVDTFDMPQPRGPHPGLVEYVTEYVNKDTPPSDVSKFIYRVAKVGADSAGRTGSDDGGIWVMPAGIYDETYPRRLAALDWEDLYKNRDGYLFFENLKAQWREAVAPDYVLIDSRTGYSDVAGICTRQLPDAVALFFFPNEQNLRGLKKIVHDIRAEAPARRTKAIRLYYVMSNVPDLDDEERILAARIREFEREFQFGTSLHTIYRYSSLALLNQTVFTLKRPDSRLAREYRAFTDELVAGNPEDRVGALETLRRLNDFRAWRSRAESPDELETTLATIQEKHPTDGEVLFRLGMVRMRLRRFDEAETLLSSAIANGYDRAETRLARAEARISLRRFDESAQDAFGALENPITPPQFQVVLDLIRNTAPERLGEVASTLGVRNAPPELKTWLASRLTSSRGELQAAEELLRPLVATRSPGEVESVREVRNSYLLVLIGLRRFDEAIALLGDPRPDPSELTLHEAFNYGMAFWAREHDVPTAFLERVLQLVNSPEGGLPARPSPNNLQCVALAYAATGEGEAARRFLDQARSALMERGGPEFSCWRYRTVGSAQFIEDLDDLSRSIGDRAVVPYFMRPEALYD